MGAAVLLLLYFFDEEGSCMDLDGVWDHDQKICRYDCLAWTKETGCIPHDDPGSKPEPVLSEAVGQGTF